MTPYEVTYQLGRFQSSVVVQADSAEEATQLAREHGWIPRLADVLTVKPWEYEP